MLLWHVEKTSIWPFVTTDAFVLTVWIPPKWQPSHRPAAGSAASAQADHVLLTYHHNYCIYLGLGHADWPSSDAKRVAPVLLHVVHPGAEHHHQASSGRTGSSWSRDMCNAEESWNSFLSWSLYWQPSTEFEPHCRHGKWQGLGEGLCL